MLLLQIEDLSSLMAFMRYNDFENDEHAVVEGCEPERTPAGSIANRLDPSPPESKCAFSEYDWMVGHRGAAYGLTMLKVLSFNSLSSINQEIPKPHLSQSLMMLPKQQRLRGPRRQAGVERLLPS